MSNLHYEWGSDYQGNQILVIWKKRGHISQKELADFLLYELRKYGYYISIINANECVCGVGWFEDEQAQGDRIELYYYDHEEHCPVCGKMSIPSYCVHCGHAIDLTKDYAEPIKVFGGDGKDRRPFYQLACSYTTESGTGVCACGVSDSMEGIRELMHNHVQELIPLDWRDPFFSLPIPTPSDSPVTVEYEWDYAHVKVKYVIAPARVVIRQEEKETTGR